MRIVGGGAGARWWPETSGRHSIVEGRARNSNATEFTANRRVRKPLETSEDDDRIVIKSVSAQGGGTGPARRTPAALLVITDDPEVRDLLMELAIEEGWGVRAVETEAEAAIALQTERPGLVMVDLDMESRAGGKFLRTLQRSPHRDIPCYAVTRSNNTMLAVTLDAPVYFKPALDGLPEALQRLFGQVPAPPPLPVPIAVAAAGGGTPAPVAAPRLDRWRPTR